MSENDLFRTARLQSLRGATPAYMPGVNVYLQREVLGFAKGSLARIIAVQSTRPGEHRYHLMVGDQKLWAFEADIRPAKPRDIMAVSHADPGSQLQNVLGTTQRLHTMTLSQRMAGLGAGPGALRMHPLTQEERLKKLVQTNRMRTLAAGDGDGGAAAHHQPETAAPAQKKPDAR